MLRVPSGWENVRLSVHRKRTRRIMYPPRLPFATDVILLQVLLLIYDTEDGGRECCSEAQKVYTLVERIHQARPFRKKKHRQPLVDDILTPRI